jgi:hypothetical protein
MGRFDTAGTHIACPCTRSQHISSKQCTLRDQRLCILWSRSLAIAQVQLAVSKEGAIPSSLYRSRGQSQGRQHALPAYRPRTLEPAGQAHLRRPCRPPRLGRAEREYAGKCVATSAEAEARAIIIKTALGNSRVIGTRRQTLLCEKRSTGRTGSGCWCRDCAPSSIDQ